MPAAKFYISFFLVFRIGKATNRLSDNDKRYLKRRASEALDADVESLVQVNDTLQRAGKKKDKELQLEQNKAIVRKARLRKECEQEFERRHEFLLVDLETMKRHLRNDSTNVEELKNLRLVVAALAKEKISLVTKCECDVKAVRKEKDVIVTALTKELKDLVVKCEWKTFVRSVSAT